MAEIGAVYLPDPQIARFAVGRRQAGQRAYSLCGITHTIASDGAMGMLCAVLPAQVQSWDAMIYTSRSVRDAAVRPPEHYGIGRAHVRPPVTNAHIVSLSLL